MLRKYICCCALLIAAPVAGAAEPAAEEAEDRDIGMSIVGNHEAPKSLVIVPWKSAELGMRPGLSGVLDDMARPVDKDVFKRELEYYRIRSE
ncbi:MAG TPA: hypothetical protein VMQ83_02695 [Gammaproteobacteria bacterium]|nr:hypothetical protein [Gammaproteobacteria bacterium]